MDWLKDKKVLVPVDFSEQSDAVVDTVLEMGIPATMVFVIYVAPDLSTMTPGVVWDALNDTSRRANVEQAFEKIFRDEKYQQITFEVAFGEPGHKIVEYAEMVGVDMIVMPSHGRTGMKRLLLGSVAERVLRLAHCAVLVLKH